MTNITIPKELYDTLIKKAEAYDRICSKRSQEAKARNARMSPEQRSANAKKAVEARIAKYGQQKKK